MAELLGRLEAPQGVWAVLGNHDFWTDGEGMARALRRQGMEVLRNARSDLVCHGDTISLVGVDDPTLGMSDLRLALRGAARDSTRLLLAHNPSIIRQASSLGIELVLAGHTHGGQIRFGERHHRLKRVTRLGSGWGQWGRTQIYVNRGLGTVVVPLRLKCPPEITLLELQPGDTVPAGLDMPGRNL